MEAVSLIFSIAGAVIILGFLGEWIFAKTNIPDPFWLMTFGVILAQFYDVRQNPAFVDVGVLFTTFALIFMLFEGVLNINLRDLLPGLLGGGGLTIISFLFSTAVVTIGMLVFQWGFLESLLMGVISSDLAQAVIIPVLKKIKISSQAALTLTFESAFSDVFGIVGAFTIINIITLKSFTTKEVLAKILYSFAPAMLIGVAAGFIWVKIHERMDKFSKSYITTVGALLLLYGGVEYVGASGPLACLAFGIVVGSSREIFQMMNKNSAAGMESGEKFFYAEVSFFVKSFFFVYLGLVINLNEPILIFLGLLLTMLLFMVRPLAVNIAYRKSTMDEKSKTYLQIMIPKGTSAAVLAMLPAQYGIAHAQDFSTIILSIIAFSILFTIIFVFFTERGKFHGVANLLRLRKAAAPQQKKA